MGLTYHEAFYLEVGFIQDLLIEKSNDAVQYPVRGNMDDIKRIFG